MPLVAAAILLSFSTSLTLAADKDEDKAKEAAVAFLKAVKAKDLDAVMKTLDVPCLSDRGKLIEKTDDLKAELKTLLGMLTDAERIPTEAGEVLDLAAIRAKFEKGKEEDSRNIEKVLAGKGYAVMPGKERALTGAVLVRINKDGKAVVVGLPR